MSFVVAFGLVSLAGCGRTDARPPGSDGAPLGASSASTSTVVDKFAQTWTKPYGQTTCEDFLMVMDPHQKFVVTADMLVGARHTEGNDDLPTDELIRDFQTGMTTACEPAAQRTRSLVEVATALYLTMRGPLGR